VINYFEEDSARPILDFNSISKWVQTIVEAANFNLAEVNYIFCSDDYLYEMNKKYLNHDFLTDIITFNYNDGKYISGDLFISVDRVNENARNLEVELNSEFLRVMIHGILHLMGFNDNSDEEERQMRLEEDKYLKLFFDVKKI